MFLTKKKAKAPSLRSLRSMWMAVLICVVAQPRPALAISEAELFQNPAFVQVYAAILATNSAMKVAAMNPMNKDPRQKVREAIQRIPPALIGLAEQFESGKLHDGDYKFVMGMLGGFVDQKSAPQIYSKFMKKPSADLIPKAGAGVQARLDRDSSGAGSRIVYDEGAPSADGQQLARQSQTSPSSKEVVNLSAVAGMDASTESHGSSKIVYDESAQPAAKSAGALASKSSNYSNRSISSISKSAYGSSSASGSAGGGTRSPASEPAGTSAPSGEGQVQSDLSVIEAGIDSSALDKDFLNKPLEKKQIKNSGRPAAPKRTSPFAPKQAKPVSFNHLPGKIRFITYAFETWSLFGSVAHAEDEGESDCQDCKKGKRGGKGGGSGGLGGQQATQLLFGTAAIMASIVPVLVAQEQANTDKEIAATNANAQMYMTDAVAKNSETLANMAQQTAKYQTDAQVQSVGMSNDAATGRLDMQLKQLESSQARIASMQQQQFEAEQALNQKRLELSEQQLAANVAAAQAAQNLQVTQAGLSLGSTPQDSGSSLTTTQTGLALASTSNDSSALGSIASSVNPNADAASVGLMKSNGASRAATGAQVASANNVGSFGGASGGVGSALTAASGGAARGLASVGSSDSGSSVGGKAPSDTVVFADSGHADTAVSGDSSSGILNSLLPSSSDAGTPSARLALSIGGPSTSSANLSRSVGGEAQVVAYLQGQRDLNGSTRGLRAREKTQTKPGDLSRFIASTGPAAESEESFAKFQQNSVGRTAVVTPGSTISTGHGAAVGSATVGRGISGARPTVPYNAPK